jgi:WD40 repeat protein
MLTHRFAFVKCHFMEKIFAGRISLHEYDNEENTFKSKLKPHKGTVRSLEFDSSGTQLVSGGADMSFQIIDTVSIFLMAISQECSVLF